MKTKKLLFMIAASIVNFITMQANAHIFRVNNLSDFVAGSKYGDNLGGTAINPVFAQISDANTSNLVSANGIDTLHLEGTNIVYTGLNLTKKVVIIGTGYFLNENPKVSNTVLEAELGYIFFNAGSEGSQLIGVHIGVNSSNGIGIYVSNIIVKRCRIDYDITVTYNIADITIVQNYFANVSNSTYSAISTSGSGFPTNFIFDNNICKSPLLISSGTTIYNADECNNNVFDCPTLSSTPTIQMNTGSFKNNILKNTEATVNINDNLPNSNVSYNISSSPTGQFGTENHNIVITDMSTLFVDPATNSTDGRYQLIPGSAPPGADSTERGAFGGLAVSNHYTLSGLAPIPVIYNIATSGVAGSSGLNVSISARTIK